MQHEIEKRGLKKYEGAIRSEINDFVGDITRDGRAYVVQQTESRDGDTLAIRATVLLARIEDAAVGEFVSVLALEVEDQDDPVNCTEITTFSLGKFQRVSEVAWERVE